MNNKMSQGNVYFMNLDYSQLSLECKRRPYLIVSYDIAGRENEYVTVLPMRTLKRAKDKWLWECSCNHFNDRRSAIICDKIITVPRYVFHLKDSEWVGTVSEDTMAYYAKKSREAYVIA